MTNAPTGQIFALLPKVMSDVGHVGKNRQNQQQHYAFRGIDDLYQAIQPVFCRHGVFVVPAVLETRREERKTQKGATLIYTMLTVKHTFYAPDGSSVEAVTAGEAMDSGDKSANKAMSAAMKYALIETLCIPTDEPIDTENDSPEAGVAIATAAQVREMKSLLPVADISDKLIEKWFSKAGVESWENMPADVIQACIDYMKNRLPASVASA